jgi:hypothetical protein
LVEPKCPELAPDAPCAEDCCREQLSPRKPRRGRPQPGHVPEPAELIDDAVALVVLREDFRLGTGSV